jgi:hypothetical protein
MGSVLLGKDAHYRDVHNAAFSSKITGYLVNGFDMRGMELVD